MYPLMPFSVIFFIVILPDELQSHPQFDWFDNVKTRLCDSQEVHTAVIIHDQDTGDSDAVRDEIYGKIIGSMSSVIVEIVDGDIDLKQSDFGVISKLSHSLLFIFYTEYSGENERLYQVMHLIDKLADFAINHLLIILRTSSDLTRGVEDILRNTWKESMLNVVIVEIRLVINFHGDLKVFSDNTKSLDCKDKESMRVHTKISNDTSNQVIIHLFNPFINQFYHKKFSTGMELFPNFAENMYQYPLKVVVLHRPPFSFVSWYKNDTIEKMSGPNIIMLQTLAEKLNFSVYLSPKEDFSRFWRGKFTVETYLNMTRTLKVDMAAQLTIHYLNDVIEESMRSRTIMKLELGMLMPKNYEINKKNVKSSLESGALTSVIIMTVWFAVILLKFDEKVWQLWSIFRLIFSSVVPHQPSRTYERILFLFVVMLGFMYSNDIYASLTNLGVDNLVENKYETLKDIEDSGLTLMVSVPRTRGRFWDIGGGRLKSMKKSHALSGSADCPQMAMVHRNVCCMLYREEAEFYIQSNRKENGNYLLMFAKAILRIDDAAFQFSQDLPGREKMNQVITRCEEVGLLSKWYAHLSSPSGHKTDANDNVHLRDEMLKNNLLKQLIVVIVFGHSLATAVFIGELLIHRFGNPFRRKGKINSWNIFRRKTK